MPDQSLLSLLDTARRTRPLERGDGVYSQSFASSASFASPASSASSASSAGGICKSPQTQSVKTDRAWLTVNTDYVHVLLFIVISYVGVLHVSCRLIGVWSHVQCFLVDGSRGGTICSLRADDCRDGICAWHALFECMLAPELTAYQQIEAVLTLSVPLFFCFSEANNRTLSRKASDVSRSRAALDSQKLATLSMDSKTAIMLPKDMYWMSSATCLGDGGATTHLSILEYGKVERRRLKALIGLPIKMICRLGHPCHPYRVQPIAPG